MWTTRGILFMVVFLSLRNPQPPVTENILQELEYLMKVEACSTAKHNLFSHQVLVNKDELSELESENRILQPQDEREVNRIIPNHALRVQPIFVDPGTSTKSVKAKQPNKHLANGLCLNITGRVQHESNELKGFMMEMTSNGEFWPRQSVNGDFKFAYRR